MNESNQEKYSKGITSKKMVQFSLIAPVAGLLSGMWGNIQFFAVHALLIPQILITIIYLAYSIIDAINDPIIGYMTDRSKKYTAKYGKRYLWILIGVISTPILLILCFIPISTNVVISIIWLMIIMTIYETSLTLNEVSYTSLYPDMFREQYQRRKVSLIGAMIGGITAIFGAIFIPITLSIFGGAYSPSAYLITTIIIVIMVYILTIPYMKGVKETSEMKSFRTQLDESGKSSSPLKEVLARIFKDRNWMALIIANTSFLIAGACVLYGLNFFVIHNLELDIASASIPGVAYIIVAIISAPFWMKIAKKIGIKKSYSSSLLLNTLGFFLFFFVNDLLGMTLSLMFIGMTASANQTVIFNLATAEAIDNATINSEKREEGTYNGVLRIFSAFSYFFQTLIFAIVSLYFGFDASSETGQTDLAKLGLNLQMSLIPMCITLIGFIFFILMYKITKEDAEKNIHKLIKMGL